MTKTFRIGDIRHLVRVGAAEDVTLWTDAALQDLRRKSDIVAVSSGTYGVDGLLLLDATGKLYAVTHRGNAIFVLI